MSKPDIWIPFFYKDFFNATTHLTLEQQMAYLRLICGAWDRGGKLPLDMEQLRLISTMGKREWKKSSQILMDFFKKNDTFFSHKRVDKELEKANVNIGQKSLAGKASAAKKAEEKRRLLQHEAGKTDNGRSTDVETTLPTAPLTADPRELQRQINPSPSPSPSPIIFDNGKKEMPPKPVATAKSRGHRLPEDWRMSPADRKYAVDLGLDPLRTEENFRDFWHASARPSAVKLRWDLAWKTWCRTDAEKKSAAGQPQHKNGFVQLVADEMRKTPQPPALFANLLELDHEQS